MALVRWITEMGMGVDVHGYDYTKAAKRAVSDGLRHSSLNFFRAAGKTVHDMHVEVRIAVARPDEIDIDAVAAEVPYGTVTITPVQGGLDVEAPEGSVPAGLSRDGIAIANAAILVSFEEPSES
jgi:uncharacterized protein (TIGR02058 family)